MDDNAKVSEIFDIYMFTFVHFYFRIKLNDPIEIATHLVLQESLKSNLEGTSTSQEHEINELPAPKEYELISILVHSGSAYGGHYFCYVKDVFTSSHEAATSSNNSNWLLFNDSTVTSISQDQLNIILGAPSSTSTPTSSHGAQPVVPSANNAYMLLYRQISPINLFDISHSLENLPQDLVKQIQNENSIYLEQKAKYEYERAFLHIALSHLIVGDLHSNDLDAKKSGNPASKYKVFRIHETSSLAELTTMVYNELYLSSPDSQPGNTPRREDVRLRVYDSIKGSLLPPMALFAKDILEKYNLRYPAEEGFIIADQSDLPTQIQMETATVLSSLPDTTLKRVFHLEIKSETENFSILDCGQGIHLNLEICLYCPNPENGESTFSDPYPLQISSNQSLDRLLDAVAEKLSPHHSCWQNQDHQNLVSSVVFVTHDISTGLAKYLYPSKNSNINLSSPLSQLLSNNDRLYVDFDPSSHSRLAEVNPPHISSVITLPESSSRIGLMDYFDGVYNEITLQYTNLNALPDLIRLDIRVDRRLSMGLLKQKIATALNISPNSFIFLRGTDNDSDPQLEIKNLNLSIAESGLQDGSYLRLNFGSPLNNGDYRIHLLQKSVLPVSQQISHGGYNPNSHQIYTKLEPCIISSNQSIQSFKSWYKETYLSNEEGDVNIRVQFTQLVPSEGVPEDTSTSINNQQTSNPEHEKCLQLYKPLFILSDKKTFKDCLGNQLKDGIYLTITTHVHETAFDDTNDLAIALWEWFIHPLPNNENYEDIKKQHMLIFHEEIVVNKDLSFENFSEYLYLHHISSSHPIPHDQTQYKIYYTKPFTWQLKDIQNIPTLKWSSQPESSSCSLSGPPYRLRNNPQSGSTTLLFYYCTMTDYHHLLQSSQSLTGSDNLIHERLPIEASFRLYTPQEQIIRKKEEEKNEIERKQIIEEKLKILHGTLQKSKNEK